jgi:hypothetical protein
MWIHKYQRRKKGVNSPIPTQMLSAEEFIPPAAERTPEAL